MFKKKEKVNDPQKLTNGNLFAYGTLLLMMNTTNAANIYFYRIALGSTVQHEANSQCCCDCWAARTSSPCPAS